MAIEEVDDLEIKGYGQHLLGAFTNDVVDGPTDFTGDILGWYTRPQLHGVSFLPLSGVSVFRYSREDTPLFFRAPEHKIRLYPDNPSVTMHCHDCKQLFEVALPVVPWGGEIVIRSNPLQCPKSGDHQVEKWKHPGPCPRCWTQLDREEIAEVPDAWPEGM